MYEQIQPVAVAATLSVITDDDGTARRLPVGTYRDEDLGAVGGAVGGDVSYARDFADASVTPSHEVHYMRLSFYQIYFNCLSNFLPSSVTWPV